MAESLLASIMPPEFCKQYLTPGLSDMFTNALNGAQQRVDRIRCDSWAPEHVTSNPGMLSKLLKVVRGEPTSIRNGIENTIDLGFTFSTAGASDQLMLVEIKRRFQAAGGRRIPVLDVGAGSGSAAWKMLVAGGNVDVVERSKSLAASCKENMLKGMPFLRPGENPTQCFHIYVGDVLGRFFGTVLNKYEIIFAGNILHMIDPKQVDLFFQRLFAMLQPGGLLVLTSNTPSIGHIDPLASTDDQHDLSSSSIEHDGQTNNAYDIFMRRKDRGETSPGFMVFTQVEQTLTLDENRTTRGQTLRWYREAQSCEELLAHPHQVLVSLEPHPVRDGVCLADFATPVYKKIIRETGLFSGEELHSIRGTVSESVVTRIQHLFDLDIVRQHAVVAGFDVADMFYSDMCNQRCDTLQPSRVEFLTKYLHLNAHLRKPDSSASDTHALPSPSSTDPSTGRPEEQLLVRSDKHNSALL